VSLAGLLLKYQPLHDCYVRLHSIGGMDNERSDDVMRSTVGLYTDLKHQGQIGRLAILAKSGRSDVRWKLSGCKHNSDRP
jgi:hypothetical protein